MSEVLRRWQGRSSPCLMQMLLVSWVAAQMTGQSRHLDCADACGVTGGSLTVRARVLLWLKPKFKD